LIPFFGLLTAAAYKLAYENAIGLLTDFICFPAENARNKNANTPESDAKNERESRK